MVVKVTPEYVIELLQSIDGLESIQLDTDLIYKLLHQDIDRRPITFHVPSFKQVETSEFNTCEFSPWPSISITGNQCKLMCDHCQARILAPMIAAPTPERLWYIVEQKIGQGARGMLLSGGSNHRNEVDFAPYYPVLSRIKREYPFFQVAVHTGLVTPEQADGLQESGVDIAMMDVIGAQQTITQVYHLKRTVDDFYKSLETLCSTRMRVVPHIVLGLHYGEWLGEENALEMVAASSCDALVLVVAMPQYAKPDRPFKIPDVHSIGEFFLHARQQLSQLPILLGCARPAGLKRSYIDSYALLAGLDGIAHPADGIIEMARRIGRGSRVEASCCSVSTLNDLALLNQPDSHRQSIALIKAS